MDSTNWLVTDREDGGHSRLQQEQSVAKSSSKSNCGSGTTTVYSGSGSSSSSSSGGVAEVVAKSGSCEAATGCYAANNGLGKQNRGNNSNKYSYSKIFRQYLPGSLNLNYTLNNNNNSWSSSSNANNSKSKSNNKSSKPEGLLLLLGQQVDNSSGSCGREQREEGERDQQANGRQQQQQQSSSSSSSPVVVSKSIVSALSRFKISSSVASSTNNNKQWQSNQSEEPSSLLLQFDSNSNNNNLSHQYKVCASESRQVSIDSSIGGNRIVPGASSKNWSAESGAISAADKVACGGGKVKRKGFLYLKRSSFALTSNLSAHDSSSSSSLTASTNTTLVNQANNYSEEKRKVSSGRQDLNNNSISSLLSSTCHHDEHKTCLLSEEEEGEAAEEEEEAEGHEKAREVGGNSKVYSYNKQYHTKQKMTNENNTRQRQQQHQKKPAKPARRMQSSSFGSSSRSTTNKGGDSKALILAGCLVSMAVLSAILSSKLVLAQQQPFARSQSVGALTPQQNRASGQSPSGGGSSGLPVGGGGGPPGASGVGSRPTPQPAAGSLVANINCNKIRGHVTLTPNLQSGTTVSTQISAGPPGEVYQWSVHQFPVKPGAAMCSCSPLILGTKLIDLSEMHGNLPSDQEFNVQSSLNLFGFDSPVGHSLMLRGMKTGMVACATFLPTSRKSNYRAKFHTPLSGSVTIFQTAFGTSFISHLMYSNGTRRHSMHRFDLVKSDEDIVTTSLLSGAQAGGVSSTTGSGALRATDSSLLALEQREHENELSQCRRYTNGEPLFKNMTYQLAVSTENFGMRGRTSMVLPQIPFETFSSVYLVVYSEYDPSEPIACAPLKFVKPKTAAAKFQSVSVQGSVVFSQDSPYDVTVARINLNLPNSDGHSYGIDELPMIIRRKSDTRVCPNIREIIYNPHHVEPSSVPPEGEATSDQYAVGDLSGKYGSLTGKATEKIQVNDFNLPLFGPISIVGRAMTIYSAEGVAIACSNVELTTPMTTAFATFDFGIQGQFIFRQPVNDCNGDTYVYIEVSKPVVPGSSVQQQQQPDMFRSIDHNWHIHVNPVDSGLDHLSTTDCLPAGPHYNPYNTSTSSIYSRDCTPFNVLRCELGDLSAKMFTIEIPPYRVKGGQEPDIGKFFGTDIDLPLCGPVSIVNRSVVVHVPDFGTQRLACSTVIEFKPRTS